jgi:DNA mismatch repair protein MutS
LSAIEHKDSIVFLHAVQPGPASQSYGLQVAQLAGVPSVVIRAARKHLALLEAQSINAAPQFDLFNSPPAFDDSPAPPAAPAMDAAALHLQQTLDDIDPDLLTPRQALDALYRLKQLNAGERE